MIACTPLGRRRDEVLMARNWNALIEDVVAGRWKDPETGKPATVPFETIVIDEDLTGREAALVKPLGLGGSLVVVADENTWEAMGKRVARALSKIATVKELVLKPGLHCEENVIADISTRTNGASGLVAVGGGVLSDSVKYATFKDGRSYCTFGTSASMNGYAATTASVTLKNGLKTSLPSHAPKGIFLDLKVSAAAPTWLSAAGLGDSLCRPTAQVDWWFSHRMLGTMYSNTPYALQDGEEEPMLTTAPQLATHGIEANGILQRVLTLAGLGVCFTQVSHHGSMGEHSISHWIDTFAGDAHPGTTHGTQVGVASLSMARLHHKILAMQNPPQIKATRVDEAAMLKRYGPEIGPICIAEHKKKAMDGAKAAAFNEKLKALWPTLRAELLPMCLPVERMETALKSAGGPTTAAEMNMDVTVYRNSLRFGREIRNRYSFLDLADDAELLEDFVLGEQ
jgi:glycerol-1-phosphate dehydrogenase [NAD(P)+]